jgi:hypothetical protein
MKKYVYIIVNSDTNEIYAAYESETVAKKLLDLVSKKVKNEAKIIKQRLNIDVTLVGNNG